MEARDYKPIFIPAIHGALKRMGVLNPVIYTLEEWGVLVPNNPIPTIDPVRVENFIQTNDNNTAFIKQFNKDNEVKWNDFKAAYRQSHKINVRYPIDPLNPPKVSDLFDPRDPLELEVSVNLEENNLVIP